VLDNHVIRRAATAAAFALTCAGPAQGAHSAGNGPPHDFVRGAGENIFATSFQINVRQGARDSEPHGRFSFAVEGLASPFVNRGVPTCLRVESRRATFGGRLDEPVQTPGGPVGAVLVTVTDGDPAGDGVTFHAVPQAPRVCPPPLPLPDDALVSGEVSVHDGRDTP
jgi:hypothetical protein